MDTETLLLIRNSILLFTTLFYASLPLRVLIKRFIGELNAHLVNLMSPLITVVISLLYIMFNNLAPVFQSTILIICISGAVCTFVLLEIIDRIKISPRKGMMMLVLTLAVLSFIYPKNVGITSIADAPKAACECAGKVFVLSDTRNNTIFCVGIPYSCRRYRY